MQKLIAEMKEDLLKPEYKIFRNFYILENKNIIFNANTPAFVYYEDEHTALKEKLTILENNGYISNITEGNTLKYKMNEDFIQLLLKY